MIATALSSNAACCRAGRWSLFACRRRESLEDRRQRFLVGDPHRVFSRASRSAMLQCPAERRLGLVAAAPLSLVLVAQTAVNIGQS